jgi:hypothetical protein
VAGAEANAASHPAAVRLVICSFIEKTLPFPTLAMLHSREGGNQMACKPCKTPKKAEKPAPKKKK